jgi:hypothetical protein
LKEGRQGKNYAIVNPKPEENMAFFNLTKKKSKREASARPHTKKIIHLPMELNTAGSPPVLERDIGAAPESDQAVPQESTTGEPPQKEAAPATSKFQTLLGAEKKGLRSKLPRKYLLRTAMWDIASIISLSFNAILLGVVILMAFRISSLQNTLQDTMQNELSGLLGGLYDNFVRMDESSISTTILVEDVPIPLDFTLPVVQEQTNVTLTQDVTIYNAYVSIDTGALNINAPAAVTLPAGTSLPVSLNMDVPVQTTVLMDLQVNIDLANTTSSDPAIASLHTAFLGLQDAIGPIYCLLSPGAMDYLARPLCNDQGTYIERSPATP